MTALVRFKWRVPPRKALRFAGRILAYVGLGLGTATLAATNDPRSGPVAAATARPPATARDYYNLGTRQLAAGRLTDAEALLQTAVRKQEDRIQPSALYNLGEVRFGQGQENLKREQSSGQSASVRARMTADASNRAIQVAETALAGNDLQQMLAAYLNGRGVRKDLRTATEAVQRAMGVFGDTLLKWRRARGDFKGAAELNPRDTNAVQNVERVERAIARLVDSLKDMQQSAMAASSQGARLKELLGQLKGRIPKEMMPPGAAGDDDEDDEGDHGEKDLTPDALRGHQEPPSRSGHEMELMLSSEEAGELLNALRLDGNRRLPDQGSDVDKKPNRSGRTW